MTARASALVIVFLLATLAPEATARHMPTNVPAFLIGGHADYASDRNGNGRPDSVEVDIPIRVVTAGAYDLIVTVATDAGAASKPFNVTGSYGAGDHRVHLRIPGEYVASRDRDGSYVLKAEVRRAATATALDTYDYRTESYRSSSFESPPARFARAPETYAVDVDLDGKPDEVRFDALVSVAEAGRYSISACVKETRAARSIPCLKNATLDAAPGAHFVTFTLPRDALRFNSTAAYAPELHLHRGLSYLDTARGASLPFRMSEFLAGTAALALDVIAPGPGGLAASGLPVLATVETGPTRAFELSATLAEAAKGAAATVTTGATRLPDGGGRLALSFNAANAGAVLARAEDAVLYYSLLDGSGLVVNGGRHLLPRGPIVAFATDPAKPLANEPVAFTDSSRVPNGAPASFAWSFGDGTSASGPSVTHAFSRPGNYTVKLAVSNGWGKTTELARVVEVVEDRAPELKARPPWHLIVGKESAYVVPAVDPEGRPVSVVRTTGPEGVTASGLTLRWTPTASSPRDASIEYVVSDGTSERKFSVLTAVEGPEDAPRLLSAGGDVPANVTLPENATFELPLEASTASGKPVDLSLASGPEGATLERRGDGTARLVWESPPVGNHSFVVVAKTVVQNDTRTINLAVGGPAEAPESAAPAASDPLPPLPEEPPKKAPGAPLALALLALGAVAVAVRRRP